MHPLSSLFSARSLHMNFFFLLKSTKQTLPIAPPFICDEYVPFSFVFIRLIIHSSSVQFKLRLVISAAARLRFLSFTFRTDQRLQQAQRRRVRLRVQPVSSPPQRNVRHSVFVFSSCLVLVMIDINDTTTVLQQLATQTKPWETSSFQSSLPRDSQRRL